MVHIALAHFYDGRRRRYNHNNRLRIKSAAAALLYYYTRVQIDRKIRDVKIAIAR